MSSKSIYPYVYKIVDKLTGEFYIGSRKGNIKLKLPAADDILKRYFTSGKLKNKILKNPDQFESHILLEYNDYDAVYWYEQVLIRENLKNPLCLNAHYVDPDKGTDIFAMAGRKQSPEHIEKRMSKLRGKPGRKLTEEAKAQFRKPRTIESRMKQSETIKGMKHQIVECPHCGKSGGKPAMKQWHFDNCRSKNDN